MEKAEIIVSLNKDLAVDLPESISYSELQDKLSTHINHLIKNDFDKLVAYLYRIDVNEQKLKLMLKQFPQEDAGKIIALLIIERQEQKIKLRNQHKPGTDTEIPEMEKW
jgi:hypothetical protein